MRRIITLALLAMAQISVAQNSGGPDQYGYYWRSSDHPQGPVFDWVDISGVGTPVTGLTDDNATQFITMGGMVFHYYWNDLTKLVIGSNGWLSFNAVSNIAHCFPTIPTAGGQTDNYLAPFMTDLLISQAGFTTPQVYYYYDSALNRFIVTYENCPWWSQTAPGYVGNNTFQVILSSADSSITYQYLSLTPGNFNNMAECTQDLVIGIENVTGGIGLQPFVEFVPADNFAIKFYYPNPVTFQVQDITPAWNQNNENKGIFVQSGSTFNLTTGVGNVGNADVNTSIDVDAQVLNLNFTQVHNDATTIANGLSAGSQSTVVFPSVCSLVPGQYYLNTSTNNSQDLNAGNNQQVTEVNSVDMSQGDFVLSYATQNPPEGILTWGGPGGGAGVYMEPPIYPADLNAVQVFIVDQGGGQDFVVNIYDNDGPNGLPGTLLATETMSALNYIPGDWVTVNLTNPITVTDGGFYIGWVHGANPTIALGTELTAGPISRRTYEFVGGDWAEYRESSSTDFLINALMSGNCGGFLVNAEDVTPVTCFGGNDGAIDITITGGTPGYTILWDHNLGNVEDPTGLNMGVYVVSVTDAAGCSTGFSVTVGQPATLVGSVSITDEIWGGDGAIDLTVTGGTQPYTYLWSINATTQDLSGLAGGTYSVTVTDASGCSINADYAVPSQVGIEENSVANVRLAPNPTRGEVLLIGSFNGLVQIEVTDLSGRGIFRSSHQAAQNLALDLSQLANGTYLINWKDDATSGRTRLVVSR